ncbi:amino acid ABC transporter substrate-binding pro tein [Desulfonema ishimotonii]|uniref:Amino acid ABC transporter substrate-binding pro tein n=1 Tax=Desulfonema ishimotonii TaxID=45657 RepID=A0A401FXK2_9BACT|nr:transporter substrate-binding domain-containing protein [Desulfonema ishimotonii]GBC61707.1 amino acid ABC transporter substrate-binding pro tein [Desulfonema ishimotonii]
MIKKQIVMLFVIGLLMPWSALAEPMVFVTGGMSPPYIYEHNGKIMGTDVNVLAAFCRQNDISAEFRSFPWKRALHMVRQGEAAGILSLFRTPERGTFLYYPSVPINSVKIVLIGRKSDHFTIRSLADLTGKSVGVIDGYHYGPEFDSLEGLNKTYCKTKKEMITMLDRGRVNVITDSLDGFRFMCKAHGFDANRFEVLYRITENPIYVGFSKKLPGRKGELLAEKLGLFLEDLRAKGKLEQIRNPSRQAGGQD